MKREVHICGQTNTVAVVWRSSSCTQSILTILEAEACGPLLQGDVFVAVGVALLEEAGGAMLHGNERSTQGGELCVGQVSGGTQHMRTGQLEKKPFTVALIRTNLHLSSIWRCELCRIWLLAGSLSVWRPRHHFSE